MQLNKKKELAGRVFGIGKERIVFNKEGLSDIKEAITREDIRDLYKRKVIVIRAIKGRKKIARRKRRKTGKIRKKVNTRKKDYATLTRKLRAFIAELKNKEIIRAEEYRNLRKEIRSKNFRSKAHIKERINQIIKERAK